MIKPVTYQGVFNFDAHLYALEIKSRFIDQNNANGYYTGYGSELAATVVGNQIKIGTGAFVIQGRMNEITSAELVTPQMFNDFVGYVVARIETYHPSDAGNCTLKAVVNTAFSEIALLQEDVYAGLADNENKVYELPIYSFEIKNGAITNLQKLIKPIDDYARVQNEIKQIHQENQKALESVQNAKETLTEIAQTAQNSAATAAEAATSANTNAANAEGVASTAALLAEQAKNKVADLETKVIAGGTVVTVGGVAQNGLSFETDPQTQFNEIKAQIANSGSGEGSAVFKGDLPEDESVLDDILASLSTEHYQIYRIPKDYPTEGITDLASNYVNLGDGFIEFLGSADIDTGRISVSIKIIDCIGNISHLSLFLSEDGQLGSVAVPLEVNTQILEDVFRDPDTFYNVALMGSVGIYIVALRVQFANRTIYIPPHLMLVYTESDSTGVHYYGKSSYQDGANNYQVSYSSGGCSVYNATTQENAINVRIKATPLNKKFGGTQ